MANTDKDGRQREELKSMLPLPGETNVKKEITPTVVSAGDEFKEEPKKINEAKEPIVVKVPVSEPKKAAPKKAAPKKPLTISKPEAELLVRKFADKPKELKLPLDETLAEVKVKNGALREEKKGRPQQSSRIIADLRRTDPLGVKTCGRCSQRVKITEMDSKKELCEVCSS